MDVGQSERLAQLEPLPREEDQDVQAWQFAFGSVPSLKATIPEQQDVLAWEEIERRRGAGESDKDIWLNAAQQGDINLLGAFIRKPPKDFDITRIMGEVADLVDAERAR